MTAAHFLAYFLAPCQPPSPESHGWPDPPSHPRIVNPGLPPINLTHRPLKFS
ncbi:hypothetical protein GFS31_16240 [Leptolyngbya sp. BL0902]|nr:hypothetical protein GFS31_16240 [Leptolyngbya sp. BL0902]